MQNLWIPQFLRYLLAREVTTRSFMPSLLGPSMAEEEEDRRSLEAKFAAAVKVIKSLPEEGDNKLLFFSSHLLSCLLSQCNCSLTMTRPQVYKHSMRLTGRASSSCQSRQEEGCIISVRHLPCTVINNSISSLRSVPAIWWHDADVLQLLQAGNCWAMQHPKTKWLLGQPWQSQMVYDIPKQPSRVKCKTTERQPGPKPSFRQRKRKRKSNLDQLWTEVPSWNKPLLTYNLMVSITIL